MAAVQADARRQAAAAQAERDARLAATRSEPAPAGTTPLDAEPIAEPIAESVAGDGATEVLEPVEIVDTTTPQES